MIEVLAAKSLRRDQRVVDLALLLLHRVAAIELVRRDERGLDHGVAQLIDQQAVLQLRFEAGLGQPARAQQRVVAVLRELAVDLELRILHDALRQLLVADAVAEALRALLQQRLLHELVEQHRLLRLDHVGRQLVAQHLLQLGLALLPGAAHGLDGNALAVDLGGEASASPS